MLNANTARLKTIEAINVNTFETINAIYKDIEDAINKGRYSISFSIVSVYNRVTGEASINVNSKVVKCNLSGIIDFFEEQGFKCEVKKSVDIHQNTITRFLVIDWGSQN